MKRSNLFLLILIFIHTTYSEGLSQIIFDEIAPAGTGAIMSGDGKTLATFGSNGLQIWQLGELEFQLIHELKIDDIYFSAPTICLSDDGSRVVVMWLIPPDNDCQLNIQVFDITNQGIVPIGKILCEPDSVFINTEKTSGLSYRTKILIHQCNQKS